MEKRQYYEINREFNKICAPIHLEYQADDLSTAEDVNTEILLDFRFDTQSDTENVSSSTPIEFSEVNKDSLLREIAQWLVEFNISEQCGNSLLKLLRKHNLNVPQDVRTLKRSSTKPCEIISVSNGNYTHIGLQHNLEHFLENNNYERDEITVDIGIDGVPLAKSSNSQLWPILGNIPSYKKVFTIGIYHGNKKPTCADAFLKIFINEAKYLYQNGIKYKGKTYKFSLRAFICDAPARAFILGVKTHSGYFSCTKCQIKGIYMEHKVCFPGIENVIRTDQQFTEKSQKEHHLKLSILLESMNIGLVTKFPIDYMHCTLLGVTRQLLHLLKTKKGKEFSLKKNALAVINENLKAIRPCIPFEFARKQRTLEELQHWKATEFRLFLMYTGVVAVKEILPDKYYTHFLLLVCGIRILCHPDHSLINNQCAADMLTEFVKNFSVLYGNENTSYNVHSLLHLSEDVKLYGPLDSFSAFWFENFLQKLKTMVKKGSFPLQQVVNKIKEIEEFQASPEEKMYTTFKLAAVFPNNYCMIQNQIMKIHTIDGDTVTGTFLKNTINYFSYPIDSANVGIYCMDSVIEENYRELHTFKISNIKNKIMRITTK